MAVDWVLLKVSKLSGNGVGKMVVLRVDLRVGWVIVRIERKRSALVAVDWAH